MLTTIIFGAGASYDALPDFPPGGPEHPDRLPITDGLFARRPAFTEALSQFPECHPVVTYLRGVKVSVEEELERLRTQAENDPEVASQIAAIRYYLQAAIASAGERWLKVSEGVTNYKTLLDQVERARRKRPVLLVTFNYDLMLEDALRSRGIEISTIGDYVTDGNYKLVKVHGSANWGREVRGHLGRGDNAPASDIVKRNIRNAHRIASSLTDNFYVVNGPQPVTHARLPVEEDDPPARVVLFPAISIPMQEKFDFECPPDHLAILRSHLQQTDRLLTIGWRAREKHFLKLLKEELPTQPWVHSVAANKAEAEETIKELRSAGIRGPHKASERAGFTDFVRSREAADLINSAGEVSAPSVGRTQAR